MKRRLKIEYLLILMVLFSVLYVILKPRFILDNSEYFHTEETRYFTTSHRTSFSFLPENPDYDIVVISGDESKLTLHYRNLENNAGSYHELAGYSINQVLGASFFNLSKLDQEVNIVLSKNGADYYLLQLFQTGESRYKVTRIYHHDMYEQLQDSTITVKGLIFIDLQVVENMNDDYQLRQASDNYKLILKSSFFDSLRRIPIFKVEVDETYSEISNYVTEETGRTFDNIDLFRIIQFFLRNSYYEQILFSQEDLSYRGFLGTRILGKVDADKDGFEDYVILFNGKRWICDRMICYSSKKNEILWEREFVYGASEDHLIYDIDEDGEKEIIFSTVAYCNEFPIDWHTKQETGKTYISYLYVLNNDGTSKQVAGKDLIYASEPGLNRIYYLPIMEKKKIIMGIASHNEYKDRNLVVLDLENNLTDTLDVKYTNLAGIYRSGEAIYLLDTKQNNLTQTRLDLDLNILAKKTKKVKDNYFLIKNNKCMIDGKEYHILHPFTIFNDQLEFLYKGSRNVSIESIYWKNNTLYSMINEDNVHHVSSIKFEKNRKINPFFILLIILELAIIGLYLFFKQNLKIPIEFAKGNYFILYRIFISLFYWKLTGNISKIYKLPRNFATNEASGLKMLKDISDDHELSYEKHFLIFSIKVYTIKSSDEMVLIQRLSHELKNQILSLKLITDQYFSELASPAPEFKNEINDLTMNISEIAINLSKFSHINKIFLETIDISLFMNEIYLSYANHESFHLIITDFGKTRDIKIKIDRILMKIALKNLINNALEAVPEAGVIELKTIYFENTIQIVISNSLKPGKSKLEQFGNIGFTTKEKGSGIGIPISRKIIERHNGSLEFDYKNGLISAIILLYK